MAAAATTTTAAEVSVSMGVARAHARADDDGSDTALGGRRFTAAAAVERDHREFKATKGAFETAENTHFTKQAAA